MIVIPMAGLSSRFFKAGYTQPKYQLILPNGKTMFEWAVSTFGVYFETDKFLFIVRDVYDTPRFVAEYAQRLGIKDFEIAILDRETLGQAETVYLGLKQSSHFYSMQGEELYIFNIDSRRIGFLKPEFASTCDGYLEVFRGEGSHWSFIEINNHDQVVRTTEKEPISDLCSDGLYYFKMTQDYINLVEFAISNKIFYKNELYIAPLYNKLIKNGANILYMLIDKSQIEFCGTPDEYISISKLMLGKYYDIN